MNFLYKKAQPALVNFDNGIVRLYPAAKGAAAEQRRGHAAQHIGAEAVVDEEKAKELEKKFKKAEFGFDDYLEQMQQIKKMGGLEDIISMIPGMGDQLKGAQMPDEKVLGRTEAIIYSMTPEERSNPAIINVSRKNRIARGAGVDIAEVNRLMKQYEQSKKLMKQMSGMMGKKGGKKGRFRLPF